MNIEEEMAQAIETTRMPSGGTLLASYAQIEALARALMPLVRRAQADELRKVGAIIRQYTGTELNASSAADIIDELARQVENEGAGA